MRAKLTTGCCLHDDERERMREPRGEKRFAAVPLCALSRPPACQQRRVRHRQHTELEQAIACSDANARARRPTLLSAGQPLGQQRRLRRSARPQAHNPLGGAEPNWRPRLRQFTCSAPAQHRARPACTPRLADWPGPTPRCSCSTRLNAFATACPKGQRCLEPPPLDARQPVPPRTARRRRRLRRRRRRKRKRR